MGDEATIDVVVIEDDVDVTLCILQERIVAGLTVGAVKE